LIRIARAIGSVREFLYLGLAERRRSDLPVQQSAKIELQHVPTSQIAHGSDHQFPVRHCSLSNVHLADSELAFTWVAAQRHVDDPAVERCNRDNDHPTRHGTDRGSACPF
jgi:hypothetical protein